MNQIVYRNAADVAPSLPLRDGTYIVEITDSKGGKSSMTLVVSGGGTQYTAPDKDGKPQTNTKEATEMAFRAMMNVAGTVITLTPSVPKTDDKDTSTTAAAEMPWGMIAGAAVLGYLIGKSS